jgi:peroxiredoxin
MSDEPSPVDRAIADAREMDAPQSERLLHVSELLHEIAPEYSILVDRLVERLGRTKSGLASPQVGEEMPGFMLPDENGRLLSLAALLAKGPVVVALLRGHWCPFCRINAAGFAEVEPVMGNAQFVAITPETQAYRRAHKREAGANFPFLMDIDLGYALSLGLALWVEDRLAELIAEAGHDIPAFQAMDGWLLPMPAVFVVGADGVITARHIDPDYRRRMELDDLLAAACSLGLRDDKRI